MNCGPDLETLINLYRQWANLPETPYAYPSCGVVISKPGHTFLANVYRNGRCLFLRKTFVSETHDTRDDFLGTLEEMRAHLWELIETAKSGSDVSADNAVPECRRLALARYGDSLN